MGLIYRLARCASAEILTGFKRHRCDFHQRVIISKEILPEKNSHADSIFQEAIKITVYVLYKL